MATTFTRRVGDVIKVKAQFNGEFEGPVAWANTINEVVQVEVDEDDPKRISAKYVCLSPGSSHQTARVDGDLLPTSRRDVIAESDVIVLPAQASEATSGEIVEVV
jgi:hypothetical protein